VHVIAQALDMAIHLHPGNLPQWRANCALAGPGSLWPPKPPLERNGDIVAECDFLIAAPAEDRDQVRSGTWATIREARRQGRPVVLVLPNGTAQGSTGVAV
jgi:hypothetical protein